ncbi:MAG: hypothetical protein KDD44_07045, partial [Bdellovibrionales bacterium]|nr:hypothetical protein [Bdellovibrionales bacterium]
ESPYRDVTAKVSRGGRSYFVVPWQGYSLVGTADIVHTDSPDACTFGPDEVASLLDELSYGFSSSKLTPEHVRYVFGGLRPVDSGVMDRFARGGIVTNETVGTAHADIYVDHRRVSLAGPGAGAPGSEAALPLSTRVENLVSVAGVKYTTCRAVAERVIDRAAEFLGRGMGACRTYETSLAGGEGFDPSQLRRRMDQAAEGELSDRVAQHLSEQYGSRACEVLSLARSIEELEPLSPTTPVTPAELRFVTSRESAFTLEDVFLRRTIFGLCGSPGAEALERAATVVGEERNWTKAERERQLELLTARLGMPTRAVPASMAITPHGVDARQNSQAATR